MTYNCSVKSTSLHDYCVCVPAIASHVGLNDIECLFGQVSIILMNNLIFQYSEISLSVAK